MTTSQGDSLEALILSLKNLSKLQIFFLKYLKTLENPKTLHKSKPISHCHTTSHFCHTEHSEVSQRQKRGSLVSHFANAQNDKIGEADDKSIKNCDDKVTESKK